MKDKNSHRKIDKLTIVFLSLAVVGLIATVGMIFYFKKNFADVNNLNNEGTVAYTKEYAFITKDSSQNFWNPVYEEMKKYGDETGIYIEWMGKNITNDYKWLDLIDIAIDAKVDGIILEADSSDACIKAINKAADQGIPVVTIREDCPSSKRISYVGVSYYNLGSEYGNLMMGAVKEQIKKNRLEELFSENDEENSETGIKVLVLIDKNAIDTAQNTTLLAIQEQLSKEKYREKEIEIVTVPIDNSNDFSAEESVQDILRTPDLANIIICLNEINTVSVYQLLVERNLVGKTTIIGYSDNEAVIKAIQKNIINSSITADVKQLGNFGIDAINEYYEYGRVSDYYSVNFTVIDMTNVGNYLNNGEKDENN